MAARYWRVVGVAPRAGGRLELTGAELWLDGVRSVVAVTCTLAPVSGSVSNLSVGSNVDVVEWLPDVVAAPGFALMWDIASASPSLVGLRLKAGTSADCYPRNLTIQSSSDLATWEVAEIFNNLVFPGAVSVSEFGAMNNDPSYDSVVYQISFDGLNGAGSSADFVDSSKRARTPTVTGTPIISTAQSKFGGASGGFNGSSALAYPPSTDWSFGAGDFTIDAFVFPTSNVDMEVCACRASLPPFWLLRRTAAGNLRFVNANNVGGSLVVTTDVTTSGVVPLNAWSHIAVIRRLGVVSLFIVGSKATVSGTNSETSYDNSVAPLFVAAGDATSSRWYGYIDNLRITKGVARWVSDFVPPVVGFGVDIGAVTGGPMLTSNINAVYAPSPMLSPVSVPGAGGDDAGLALSSTTVATSELNYSGPGKISGTVFEKATPSNLAVRRRVRMFDERSALCVQETWSDPSSGAYQFVGVPLDTRYTIVAYDHTGAYRGVIADGQFAERMQ